MKSKLGNLLSLLSVVAVSSIALADPPPQHKELTRALDNAIEWSKHLKSEVAKGRSLDRAHVNHEADGLRDSFSEISKRYQALSDQPAHETAEGHFLAIKTHQEKALSEFADVESELKKDKPDYSRLKKATKGIQDELESAAREHKAELSELDVR